MVLKYEQDPDEVYVIEASVNKGVALNKWSFLRNHIGQKKFYKRAVFRHVEFNRDQ